MINTVLQNRIVKAFIQMSGAGLIVQLLALLITPILSRLYTPIDFSLFGTLCSIASLFSIVAAFRFEYAFFIKKENIQYFFILSLIFVLILTFFTSAILPHFFNYSFFILFITLLGISVYNIMTQFSVALLMYKELSVSRVAQGLTQYVLALMFGIFFLPKGLIYSFIIGQLAASVFLYFRLNINFDISLQKLFSILRENIVYGINSTFTSALQWSAPLAPMLIGSFIYPPKVLGVYFLVIQAISGLFSIPRRSLINICTSELNSPDRFRNNLLPILKRVVLHKNFLFLILGMIFVLVIVHFWGVEILSFILGDQWGEGGTYLDILILFSLLELFLFPFIHLLNLWKKYSQVIIIELSRFLFIYGLVPIFAYYYNLDFSYYILGHFCSMFIFNLITFLCLIRVSTLNKIS